jgi:hypothetical protein
MFSRTPVSSIGRARGRAWQRGVVGVTLASLLAVMGLFASTPASAVHDEGLFELDKNAVAGAAAGDDWSDVFAGHNNDCAALEPEIVDCTYISDPQGPDASIFTTGGSKDDLDIPNWRWTSGSVPDADEILNAYAAMYEEPVSEDQILYFGADRYAVNGSKDFGFWLFQNPVAQNSNGTFSGEHVGDPTVGDDDILILGTFTQGGATTTIRVFRWVGTGGNATQNGTVTGPVGAFGDCVPGSAGDSGCATVNNTTIPTGGWAYVGKKSGIAANNIASGGFVEGGINLSELGLEGCFSSVLAETRSSPSVDAQLKDFALGQFEACGVGIVTTPTDADDNPTTEITLGDSVYDHAVVTGTGPGAPVPTGSVSFHICAPDELDDPGSTTDDPNTCDVGGTAVNGAGGGASETLAPTANPAEAFADSALFTPDAVGTWCWRGDYSGDLTYDPASDSSTGECFTVIDTSSILTDQTWVPNDSATVTSGGGSDLTGTLTLTLYNNATCTAGTADANVLYRESFTLTDATSPATRTTSNGDGVGTGLESDVVFDESGSPVNVSWQAVFDSVTNSADSTGPCETSTNLAIDDNDPTP